MAMDLRKTASLLLSAVFLLQAVGCSRSDEPEETGNDEEYPSEAVDLFAPDVVVNFADRFAIAVWTCDTDEFERICDSDYSDIRAEMEDKLDFYRVNPGEDETAKVYQAIIDNLKYEIDEDSVFTDEDDGTASVDISFTLPDYEALYDDPYIRNSDDFVQEASVTFGDPFVMTIEMELVRGYWKITDYKEVFDRVYAFIGEEFDIEQPVLETDQNGVPEIELSSDHLEWWNDYGADPSNPVFVNEERIAAELPLVEDGADVTGIYATFSSGGTVLATDPDTAFITFDVWDVPEDYRILDTGSYDYYLAPGEYNITFYNVDGTVIFSQDLKIEFHADETGCRVDFLGLYSEDEVRYVNTTEITASLMEGGSYLIPVNGYATVEYKDEIVMELDNVNSNTITFSVSDAGASTDASGSYLAEGEYTVTYYDYRGIPYASGTCTVEVV